MKNIKSAFLFCLPLMLSLHLMSSCKKSDTTIPTTITTSSHTPASNEVLMQGNAFGPSAITVSVNTTVKWLNKDGVAHTVTSNTGLFDSGTIPGGSTYSRQFNAAGTFPYNCTLHSGMTGTVIVQ